jgi:hypothetical protein
MTIVFPFHAGDAAEARRLLVWIERLGPCKKHDALLVTNSDCPWWIVLELMEIAQRVFSVVMVAANESPVSGWPAGANSLFATAATFIKQRAPAVWLWLEPDAVPLKSGWADALSAAYEKCGKRYMGSIVPRLDNDERLPKFHLAGTAVYHWGAVEDIGPFCSGMAAFDMASADVVVPKAINTHLIQHFWGRKNSAPTFVRNRGPGDSKNTLPLSFIRSDAVLFHRCKDGSLIRLLEENLVPAAVPNSEFITVLPFYNGDYHAAKKNVEWMREICPATRFNAVVACDTETLRMYQERIVAIASEVFNKVNLFIYPPPKFHQWPEGANHAFQHVARHMRFIGKPWLWLEADAIPVRFDWLRILQRRYVSCGQPMLGSIVHPLGHMNGVGVYPFNLPDITPETMKCTGIAFDWVMKAKTIAITHDASDLICHVWSVKDGKTKSHGDGDCPSFKTSKDVDAWVCPGSVLFHRCKDGTLISRLREMKFRMKNETAL